MLVTLAVLLALPRGRGNVLDVGDGKPYARIEDAVDAAKPGDLIEVFPKSDGYTKTALRIRTPKLAIKGVGNRVKLDGTGFDYSGVGSVPRAIIQVDSDDVTIENLELTNAHNGSYNGAGVRINGGNRVTITGCDIHGNDMGIMSNGDGSAQKGTFQRIEGCHIHENGNAKDPGYNHNLYLGGWSVTVDHCEIDHSLTGHNLKSRAHETVVLYSYVHDSNNREFDFVEAKETEKPGSNAILMGNLIVKDRNGTGNRVVIHFGQEKGLRDGALVLQNNTIVTWFLSPVLSLSSPKAIVDLRNNIIFNPEQTKPAFADLAKGADPKSIHGSSNWISPEYNIDAFSSNLADRVASTNRRIDPGFVQGDYNLAKTVHLPGGTLLDIRWQQDNIRPLLKSRYVGKGKWIDLPQPTDRPPFIGAG